METILVAVDLKFGTQSVMAETCKYAKALNANVILVDIEPLLPGAIGIENRALIIEGSAVDQLAREVEREAASLIIIGSQPHGALVEALTYGIREQLLKRVRCPVLLVPVA